MLSILGAAVVTCGLHSGHRRIVTYRFAGQDTGTRYTCVTDGFIYSTRGNMAAVIFATENRRIRFAWDPSDPEDFRYTNHSPPRERDAMVQQEAVTISVWQHRAHVWP